MIRVLNARLCTVMVRRPRRRSSATKCSGTVQGLGESSALSSVARFGQDLMVFNGWQELVPMFVVSEVVVDNYPPDGGREHLGYVELPLDRAGRS